MLLLELSEYTYIERLSCIFLLKSWIARLLENLFSPRLVLMKKKSFACLDTGLLILEILIARLSAKKQETKF